MLSRVNVGGGGGAMGDPTSGFAIVVTYPIGAVCTCSNGSKTYQSRDTVGACIFYVPTSGSWTVSAELNGETVSKVVVVSAYGTYNVALAFEYVLFETGTNRLGAQDTWASYAGAHRYTIESNKITVQGLQCGAVYGLYSCFTFDITDFDYLVITGTFTKYYYNLQVGVSTTNVEKPANAGVIGSTTLSTSHTMTNEVICNLTNYSGQKYIYFMTSGNDDSSQDIVNQLEMTKISLTKAS